MVIKVVTVFENYILVCYIPFFSIKGIDEVVVNIKKNFNLSMPNVFFTHSPLRCH